MVEPDEITLTFPRDREFHRVAHLVLGGLAVRLNLTIEALEDLQVALGSILDRARVGGDVTVQLIVREGTLEALIRPVDLTEELVRDGDPDREGELSLRRVLWTVVDDVELEDGAVRLTKRVAGG
jgi:hypothetical protein